MKRDPYCEGHGSSNRLVYLDEGPDFGHCADCGRLIKAFEWIRPEAKRRALIRALGFGLLGFVLSGVLSWWILYPTS